MLQVVADQGDPAVETAGDEGRYGQQHQGSITALSQDPDQRRGLALAGPGHHVDVGDGLAVPALGDYFFQQLIGDGEIEQRLVDHGVHTIHDAAVRQGRRCS